MTCTCTPKRPDPRHRLCLCGTPACPAAGIYLARLYPGATFCQGCGRRTLHCTCRAA